MSVKELDETECDGCGMYHCAEWYCKECLAKEHKAGVKSENERILNWLKALGKEHGQVVLRQVLILIEASKPASEER